jgi:hypothetical protein
MNVRPRRRTTTDPALRFNDFSELRTFMTHSSSHEATTVLDPLKFRPAASPVTPVRELPRVFRRPRRRSNGTQLVPPPRRPVRTYASRHGTGRRAPGPELPTPGGIVQGGGPPERLRGVQDVVPRVDTPFESTSVRVDASRLTFADFYRATFTDMTQLALLLTGSAETAHDLVQDSFVRRTGSGTASMTPRLPPPHRGQRLPLASPAPTCATTTATARQRPPASRRPEETAVGAEGLEPPTFAL